MYRIALPVSVRRYNGAVCLPTSVWLLKTDNSLKLYKSTMGYLAPRCAKEPSLDSWILQAAMLSLFAQAKNVAPNSSTYAKMLPVGYRLSNILESAPHQLCIVFKLMHHHDIILMAFPGH